jgi:hypothetical protein
MSVDSHNSQKDLKSGFTFIPAAALKRFADDLGNSDNPQANKFLHINRERVHDFVEKPTFPPSAFVSKGRRLRNASSHTTANTHVPGIYNYNLDQQSPSTFLTLQKLPEFQPSLGARSRFGEGDGSFFDRWLNCDIATSKHLYDKDGFPLMRFGTTEVKNGFKHHLKEYQEKLSTNGSAPPFIRKTPSTIAGNNDNYIKPYSLRRLERLEKEKRKYDKSNVPDELPDGSNFIFRDKEHQSTLPKISSTLSAVEKENFAARQELFEHYRQEVAQQYEHNGLLAEDDDIEQNLIHHPPSNPPAKQSAKFAAKKNILSVNREVVESNYKIKKASSLEREDTFSWLQMNEVRHIEEEKQLVQDHLSLGKSIK